MTKFETDENVRERALNRTDGYTVSGDSIKNEADFKFKTHIHFLKFYVPIVIPGNVEHVVRKGWRILLICFVLNVPPLTLKYQSKKICSRYDRKIEKRI